MVPVVRQIPPVAQHARPLPDSCLRVYAAADSGHSCARHLSIVPLTIPDNPRPRFRKPAGSSPCLAGNGIQQPRSAAPQGRPPYRGRQHGSIPTGISPSFQELGNIPHTQYLFLPLAASYLSWRLTYGEFSRGSVRECPQPRICVQKLKSGIWQLTFFRDIRLGGGTTH
jgi:hypothetical protein